MKAITSLIGDIIAVIILMAIATAYSTYYEAKQNGEDINLMHETSKQVHIVTKDIKDGWNSANDTIK